MRRLAVVATLLTLLMVAAVKPANAVMYGGGGGGMDVGKVNIYGDNWLLFKSVSFDDPTSIAGSQDSDTAFLYRIRAGLFGKLDDRNGYKFRFTTVSCMGGSGYYQSGSGCRDYLYGNRFGGGGAANPTVYLEHGYLYYRWSDRAVTYAGRVPTYPLSNDLLFSSGEMRGNDRAYDGLFWSFDLADNTNLYLGWGQLSDTPGNKPQTTFILGQLKHNFSDSFWAYVGAANFSFDAASADSTTNLEDYTAFFVKGSYDFTPEFNLWGEFLSSNGNIDGNAEVGQSDSSAIMIGGNYKASKTWTIGANWATIGGSSVEFTSITHDDYVMNGLNCPYPSGSVDNDCSYLNLHLHYTVNDHNMAMFDYTSAQENNDDGSAENTGTGFFVSWATNYG